MASMAVEPDGGGETGSQDTQDNTIMNPWPFISPFFKFVCGSRSTSNGFVNLKFRCKLCSEKEKELSCQSSSLANLKKHIERKHKSRMKDFEATLMERLDKTKKDTSQQPITSFMQTGRCVTQNLVNEKVLRFILETGQPFSIVREESFVDLVVGTHPGKKVPSYETLMIKISDKYKDMKEGIIRQLSDAQHVCVTADLWSSARRSYLGMTGHILNSEIERKSFGLACRHIRGQHTFDVLAVALEDILAEFNIQYKVVGAITDNGSNFVKCFKIFGPPDTNEDDADETDSEMAFEELEPMLQESDAAGYRLPPHFRCAAHTLNLIASKDTEKALANSRFAKASRSTFGKLQGLWNKQNKSDVFADLVHKTFGTYFLTPVITRWNSTYNAVEKVRKLHIQDPQGLNSLLANIKIPPLTSIEVSFIQEFCSVMKPVAKALDILQGEKGIYIGYLLPTLTLLKKKMKDKCSEVDLCIPLAESVLQGIDRRFSEQFEDRKMIVAAVYLPDFKLSWLPDEDKNQARQLLLEEMQRDEPTILEPENKDEDEESFFPKRARLKDSPEEELSRFLVHPSYEIESLKQYGRVLSVFMKYNTLLPSSASSERLFSKGKFLFRSNRYSMKDSSFEMQLLLNVNGIV